MKEEEVMEALRMEEDHDTAVLESFERDLSQMYASLPKNEHGNVGHQAVRYALHRYFVKQHGWFIRGLEPGNATWTPQRLPNGELPPAWVKEWVVSFLQDKLEHRPGHHGVSLRDLAAMAATIEDLVHKEASLRLQNVYVAHGEFVNLPLARAAAEDVLSTFYVTFLLANNLTANSKAHLLKKKAVFKRSYRGYKVAHQWFKQTVNDRLGKADPVDFALAAQVVNDIGLKYHSFNEIECTDLRKVLQQMEGRKPGRVRLSVFYNMTRFTHWRFTERPEYLKSLGALDDTDPKQLSLITANYVMARPNCLDASNLYTLCCTNACEDLMSHLEGQIGNATASPEQITSLVSELNSDTVEAPRQLPEGLVGRLNEIANLHSGKVPLHGRLFGQWMHHAYPRECPYPHEAGSVSPQTAEEWTRETGSSEQSTDEERQKIVDADTCTMTPEGQVDCGEDSGELPWSTVEELLVVTQAVRQKEELQQLESSSNVLHLVVCCWVVAGVAVLVLSSMYRGRSLVARCRRLITGVMLTNSAGIAMAFVVLLLLLTALDLLDGAIFLLALGVSFVFYFTTLTAKKSKAKHKALGKAVSL